MAYATIDDIFARYSPLTTMVGTGPQEITSVQISSSFIPDAEGFVNAFLAARYQIPVGQEPLITRITSDLAICAMIRDRAPRLPEFMDRRCTDAEDMLKMLRDGEMVLVGSGTVQITGGDQYVWSNVDPDEGFAGPAFTPMEASSYAHRYGPGSCWCP